MLSKFSVAGFRRSFVFVSTRYPAHAAAALLILTACSPSDGTSTPIGDAGAQNVNRAGDATPLLDGAPPHLVGSCTAKDGSKLPVGVWENITPTDVSLDGTVVTPAGGNFGTHAFALDPAHSGSLYLGTSGQGIWKTTDCGSTWVMVNTGDQGSVVGGGRHGSMAIDPVDPNILFVDARYGPRGIFRSKNAGVDWEQVLPPDALNTFIYGGLVEWIAIDPTDHLHVTAMPHFTCQNGHSDNCMLESNDGGDSWHSIENTPPSTELGGHVMLDKKQWLAMVDSGIWRTTDGGATWSHVYSDMGAFPYLVKGPDRSTPVRMAIKLATARAVSQSRPTARFTNHVFGESCWVSRDRPTVVSTGRIQTLPCQDPTISFIRPR